MAKSDFSGIALHIGKNDARLINQALNDLEFIKQVRTIRNASLNGTGLQKMTVAKGIMPLDLTVEQREGTQRSFSGRKLMVYEGMKIIDIIPEEAMKTWMSDMLVPGAVEIPFAQWVWEQEFNKIKSEVNDNIYLSDYKGDAATWASGSIYTGGTDYVKYGSFGNIYKCVTTTTTGQSPDTHPAKWLLVNELVISKGWGKIIADEITASALTPLTTGALSSTNALDKVEIMYNGMTVAHRKLGGVIYLSHANFRNYLIHERATYGSQATPDMANGVKTVYGDAKWVIQPATWMGTSGRVIATQKDNLVFGTNMETDPGKVAKTIQTLHGYRSVVKWYQGCEIADIETLYVNDQA